MNNTTRFDPAFLEKAGWDKAGQVAAIALAFAIPISTALTSVFSLILLIAWFAGPSLSEKMKVVLHHPLVGWLYSLIIFTFLSMLYSQGNFQTCWQSAKDVLRLALIPILIYFYQDKQIARFAIWAFIGAMLVTLVFAFLKVYGHFPIGLKYTTGAVFKNHIKTSYFMAMAAFMLALQLKQFTPPRQRVILILLVIAMIYYLLFMSVGRIGYITLVFCLFYLAWQKYRYKGVLSASILAALMLSGAYYSSALFSDRINLLSQDLMFYQEGGRLLESSLGSRLEFAHNSAKLIIERPLLGWGAGSFAEIYAQKHHQTTTLLTDNPHNEYLRVGVELGLIGVMLLFLLFFRQWQLTKFLPTETQGLYKGILLSFIIGCCLNSWLMDFTESYFYCVFTAACFAQLSFPTRLRQAQVRLH